MTEKATIKDNFNGYDLTLSFTRNRYYNHTVKVKARDKKIAYAGGCGYNKTGHAFYSSISHISNLNDIISEVDRNKLQCISSIFDATSIDIEKAKHILRKYGIEIEEVKKQKGNSIFNFEYVFRCKNIT